MKKSDTVLICGGAGYIGSHVVRELMQNYRLVLVDDLSFGHEESVPEGVELVTASIGDRDRMNELFRSRDIKAVMHLCANAYVGESVENPMKYYRNNIANGLTLLECMLEHDVKKLIFSSSCSVYGYPDKVPITEECPLSPISPYGHTKAVYEQILVDFNRAYGLQYVALRYFNAAGALAEAGIGEDHDPELHLIPLVLRHVLQKKFPDLFGDDLHQLKLFGDDYDTPDGTCIRDYIHVMDLAASHRLALEYLMKGHDSIAVNLGNSRGFSLFDVVKACEDVTGMKVDYEMAGRREGDPDVLVADSTKAKILLNWQPKYSGIRQIVKSAWEWHLAHPLGYKGRNTL